MATVIEFELLNGERIMYIELSSGSRKHGIELIMFSVHDFLVILLQL